MEDIPFFLHIQYSPATKDLFAHEKQITRSEIEMLTSKASPSKSLIAIEQGGSYHTPAVYLFQRKIPQED